MKTTDTLSLTTRLEIVSHQVEQLAAIRQMLHDLRGGVCVGTDAEDAEAHFDWIESTLIDHHAIVTDRIQEDLAALIKAAKGEAGAKPAAA